MVIDIKDYDVMIVGMQTINKIEDELKRYYEAGIMGVEVNFRNKGINKEYTEDLARLKFKYKCIYKGIGNKETSIDVYLKTGYFIKQFLGVENFVKWFKKQVEVSDYPLMIKDNRLEEKYIVAMNVIQPIKFEGNYFHYNIIKPQYLEPEDLEIAIKENRDIYTREIIRIEDLGSLNKGFRFAGSYEERYILDIFEDIITGRVVGYAEVKVG